MTNEDTNRMSQYHDDGNQLAAADECPAVLAMATAPTTITRDETVGKSSSETSNEETSTTTSSASLTPPPPATTTTTTLLPIAGDHKDQQQQQQQQPSPPLDPAANRSFDVMMMMEGDDAEPTKRSAMTIIHMILVVVASSTINGVVFGVVNNFGVFYFYLIELFKQNKGPFAWSDEPAVSAESMLVGGNLTATTTTTTTTPSDTFLQPLIAGVGSVNIGLIFFCSIFASVLSDRYGIRAVCFVGGALSTIGMYASSISINIIYLYITYGLVLGIGASLVYAPSLAILGHYFTSYLGVINGLVTAGSSLFSICMPVVLRHLIDRNGVQTTFRYLSGLMVVLMLCALTFKETIPRRRREPSKSGRRSSKSSISSVFFVALWRNPTYVCWLFSIPLGLFGYFIIFCHLPKHANDINSVYGGEILVMVISIFSLVGRLISGPLSDFLHIDRVALQQVAFSSIGVLTMSLATNVQGVSLLAVCAGLGLFDGFFISLLGPIAFDLVGAECANQAIGLLLCFCSLPLTVGPPIAAYAYSIYGNYQLAFFLAGIPPIFAAIMMFNIHRIRRRERQRGAVLRTRKLVSVNGSSKKHPNTTATEMNGKNSEKLYLLNGPTTPTTAESALKKEDNNADHNTTLLASV